MAPYQTCTKCGYKGPESTDYPKGWSHKEYSEQFHGRICPDALKEEVNKLQKQLTEEIANETVDIDLGPEPVNKSGYTDEDLAPEPGCWGAAIPGGITEGITVQSEENAFQSPVTRKVLLGHSEEDAIAKHRELVENIIFELKSKAFVLLGGEIPWTKRAIADSERGWMSVGLLKVIDAIERNGKAKVSTPHDDFSWWAILKEVVKRLEAEKIMAPVQMIKQDLIVLHGRIERLRFEMPSGKK